MDASTSSSFDLTPLDCTMPRMLVTILLFFPSSHVEPDSIVESLRKGLELTVQHLPLLSGMVKDSAMGHQSGRLVVSEPYQTIDEMLAINDMRGHTEYDYDKIRQEHFQSYRWSTSVAREFYSFSGWVDLPVFRAKVTLIDGGLVFAISGHHSFTDGNGIAKITGIWSSCCRGERPTLAVDSVSRTRLMGEPGLADIKDFPDLNYVNGPGTDTERPGRLLAFFQPKIRYLFGALSNLLVKAWSQPVQEEASLPVKPVTPVLFFSNDKLKELKTLVSGGNQQEKEGSWISTQDALTALLWSSFIHARLKCDLVSCNISPTASKQAVKRQSARSEDLRDQIAVILVVINARRLLQPPLPSSFIGNVPLVTGVPYPLKNLTMTAKSISDMACLIRASINGKTPDYFNRFLSALASVDDIRRITYAGSSNPKYSLKLSSWRDQDYYNQGWGEVFGTECERARSTIGSLPNGLAIILPEIKGAVCSSSAAGLEVALGVSEDAIPHLKENKLLNHFCLWR